MINLNEHLKTKSKAKPICKFKTTVRSQVSAVHITAVVHNTVVVILPPNLQTIITAQMLSTNTSVN